MIDASSTLITMAEAHGLAIACKDEWLANPFIAPYAIGSVLGPHDVEYTISDEKNRLQIQEAAIHKLIKCLDQTSNSVLFWPISQLMYGNFLERWDASNWLSRVADDLEFHNVCRIMSVFGIPRHRPDQAINSRVNTTAKDGVFRSERQSELPAMLQMLMDVLVACGESAKEALCAGDQFGINKFILNYWRRNLGQDSARSGDEIWAIYMLHVTGTMPITKRPTHKKDPTHEFVRIFCIETSPGMYSLRENAKR